jgi:glucose-6-phosphate 1-dehydrogenase
VDEQAFARLMQLLRYVNGDYNDSSTFASLRKQLGESRRPAHYLAIPPSMFATVTGRRSIRSQGHKSQK